MIGTIDQPCGWQKLCQLLCLLQVFKPPLCMLLLSCHSTIQPDMALPEMSGHRQACSFSTVA